MTVKDAEKIETYLRAHSEHLEYLKTNNQLIISGPFLYPKKSGGVMIFKAESFEIAKEIMEKDPFIKHGVEDYDLRELNINIHIEQDWMSYH